jgi:hypothetical protein
MRSFEIPGLLPPPPNDWEMFAGLNYHIRPKDAPLIAAALALGDWLLARPEPTEEAKEVVRDMQHFIHHLPEHTPNLDGDYRLCLEPLDYSDHTCITRHWTVGVRPGALFFSSGYYALSEGEFWDSYGTDDTDEETWKVRPLPPPLHTEYKLDWCAEAGALNRSSDHYVEQWIKDVGNPHALVIPKHRLEYEISTLREMESDVLDLERYP